MRVENVEEDADVFQAGVEALAVEGEDGVGGVAEDDSRRVEVMRGAFYADEGEVWICGKLLCQGAWGDEVGANSWEVGIEEVDEGFWRVLEMDVVLCRGEEGAGE